MCIGNKHIFACEFTIHFNVRDKVALDLFKYNYNLSPSGFLQSQSLFFMKFTSNIQHIFFNLSPPEVSPRFLVYV